MKMKLIHHDPEKPNRLSVFDQEIIDVARSGAPLWIACPYVSLKYLRRMLKASGPKLGGWRLLTDVNELLCSRPSSELTAWYEFLSSERFHVRFIPGLHAKVVVSKTKALFGSANFTLRGVTRRTELSVSTSDPVQVKRLKKWFAQLWGRGDAVDSPSLEMLVERLQVRAAAAGEPQPRFEGEPFVDTSLSTLSKPRTGRWNPNAFLARVREKYPRLVDVHTGLINRLGASGKVLTPGDGPKEATYHVVVADPTQQAECTVLWIYDDGRVYVDWDDLKDRNDDMADVYRHMWEGLLNSVPASKAKDSYGRMMKKRIDEEALEPDGACDIIFSNLERLGDLLRQRFQALSDTPAGHAHEDVDMAS